MGKNAEGIVNAVSKAIVHSQSSCLAAAQNTILMDIGRARDVNIEKMSITQLAAAQTRCSQNVEVDMGSLEFDIQSTLDATVTSMDADKSDTFKMTNSISHSFKDEDVKACLSEAVNDFRIKFGNVTGDVHIYDLHIDQVAEARISRCIQEGRFQVGNVPMQDFIANTVDQIKSLQLIVPEDACQNIKSMYYGLYGSAAAAFLAVATVLIWHLITRRKWNKT